MKNPQLAQGDQLGPQRGDLPFLDRFLQRERLGYQLHFAGFDVD
jgi:hypothetical protein